MEPEWRHIPIMTAVFRTARGIAAGSNRAGESRYVVDRQERGLRVDII